MANPRTEEQLRLPTILTIIVQILTVFNVLVIKIGIVIKKNVAIHKIANKIIIPITIGWPIVTI